MPDVITDDLSAFEKEVAKDLLTLSFAHEEELDEFLEDDY